MQCGRSVGRTFAVTSANAEAWKLSGTRHTHDALKWECAWGPKNASKRLESLAPLGFGLGPCGGDSLALFFAGERAWAYVSVVPTPAPCFYGPGGFGRAKRGGSNRGGWKAEPAPICLPSEVSGVGAGAVGGH